MLATTAQAAASATLSGPILKSVLQIANALDMDEFLLTCEGTTAKLEAMNAAKTCLIEANMDMPAPVAAKVQFRQDTKRFGKAAKPFFADEAVEVTMQGNMMSLKASRRKATSACLPTETFGLPANFKVPRGLPWNAEVVVEKAALNRMFGDSDLTKRDKDDMVLARLSVHDGDDSFFFDRGEEGSDRYEESVPGVASGGPCAVRFDVEYLRSVLAPCSAKVVKMQLGTDLPAAFHYEIPAGTVYALVAPFTEPDS